MLNINNKPPRKRRSPKSVEAESTDSRHPGERQAPARAERTDDGDPARSEAERAPVPSEPVTNQDEQDRITNAGVNESDIADK